MSLLKRVERAQQQAVEKAGALDAGANGAVAEVGTPAPAPAAAPAPAPAPAPVLVPAATQRAQTAAREELLLGIRRRLQEEVSRASTALFDAAAATDVQARVAAIVDRVVRANGFAVTGDERLRLIEELVGEIERPRAAGAPPRRRHDHRGDGQRPEPDLHRAARERSSASIAPS